MNRCLRVYTCGEAKYTEWNDAETLEWLEYNRKNRPGNALFVNGICLRKEKGVLDGVPYYADTGYFALNHIEWIEEMLAANPLLNAYQPYGTFSTWRRDKLTREQQ